MLLGDASYKYPQRPFVDTFRLEDGVADEDERVEEDEDAWTGIEELRAQEADVLAALEEPGTLLQVPNVD